jgi:hypothetical protein
MLIIDAFNVLHTQGVLPPDLADPGVPGLIRLIAASRYARRDLTIVCDGSGGSGTPACAWTGPTCSTPARAGKPTT